jgi:hypothetical protein
MSEPQGGSCESCKRKKCKVSADHVSYVESINQVLNSVIESCTNAIPEFVVLGLICLSLDLFVDSVLPHHNFVNTPRIIRGGCVVFLIHSYTEVVRGIPGGYLGALENRLNETEIALYNALCELRKLKLESAFTDHPDLSEPLQSRQADGNKYSRMNEWVRYPLKRSDELEIWWNSVDKNKVLEGRERRT